MAVLPRTPPGGLRLPREALTTRVGRSLEAGSVVLTAGAGFGKSTTIELALARLGWTSVRVSCDEELTDAGRLLARLVTTVRAAVPGLVDVIADSLASGFEPVDVPAVTRSLLDEIQQLMVDPLVVVIDDAEVLAGAPAALGLVNELLASPNDRLHVVLATRRPLRLRTAKLRAAGRIAEFGDGELAFSSEECGEYLRSQLGRAPDPEELDGLLSTTRGWPLGVALSSSGLPAVSPGAGSRLLDFLGDEVLGRLADPLREQVLGSSLLTEMDTALLLALGLPADVPAQARAAGLLLEQDGNERRWRYHPLQREALVKYARATLSEADFGDLCVRAALAEKGAGRREEAVRLFLLAGRHEEAAATIAAVGQTLVRTSWRTLRGWLDALPAPLRETPALQLLEGQVLQAEGQPSRADAALRAAEAGFRTGGMVAGEWAARWFRAAAYHEIGNWSEIAPLADDFDEKVAAAAGPPALALALWGAFGRAARGDTARARALTRHVMALPGADVLLPVEVGVRGYTDVPAGGLDDVLAFGLRVADQLDRDDPLGMQPIALASLALLYFEAGRHRESLQCWDRTVAEVERLGSRHGITVHAHLGRSCQLARLGRVAEAARALALAEPIPEMGFRETWLHQARATIAWRRGDASAAVMACDRAYDLLRQERATADRSWAMLTIVPVLAELGELRRARAYADETLAFWDDVLPGDSGRFWRARTLTERAWLRHLEGEVDGAVEDFSRAWPMAAGAEPHLVRSQWPAIRGLLWSALEQGAVDAASVVAAVRAARTPGSDIAAFLDHPLPEVRSVAIAPAAASGDPRAYARLESLAATEDEAARAIDRLRTTPPPLTFTLLGGFGLRRAEWEVEPSAWGRPAAAALVRFLLVRGDVAVPEDDLFEALWPGRPATKARSSLRVALSRARSVLDVPGAEASRIVAVRRTFRLSLGERDYVDAAEFAGAAAAARRAPSGAGRVEALERAAALWTGEPLPEDRYADWALTWREELIDGHLEVLGALLRARLRSGDNLGAVAVGRRLVDADPLNEGSHVQLMQAYAAAGNRSAALRQFLACRSALVDELGVEPSREVEELHRRLLAGEPIGA